MPDATEPVAWAVYGRVTGNLKYVVTDDTEATDLAEFYDVVPLVPASSLSLYLMTLGEASTGHNQAWEIAQKVLQQASLPEGLCGAHDWETVNPGRRTCVFTPHPEGTKHSWEQ